MSNPTSPGAAPRRRFADPPGARCERASPNRRRRPMPPGARARLVVLALALVAGPFTLLLLAVQDHWAPIERADRAARDGLHGYGLHHRGFVTLMRVVSDSGSALAWTPLLLGATGWLLWRRRWRLAAFTAATSIGSTLLNSGVKALVHRPRPVVAHPFVHEPGASFPSGHAQAAIVGYALLLIIILPALAWIWRVTAVTAAALITLAIGFSRIALAAHYVSDVLAGLTLGAAWIAAMAALFGSSQPPRAGRAAWGAARYPPDQHPSSDQ